MQNKIMELNIDELKKNEFDINDLDIEILKMKLVARKVRKAITKLETGDYFLDDMDINYLNDCRNLTFKDNFSYEDLVLVIKTNSFPENHVVALDSIEKASLNGILDSKPEDIIIVEPLKNQMDKITRLDVLDTRFKEDLVLSNKAIILVSYDNQIDTSLYRDYRILRYKDLNNALDKILILLEFKPQQVLENGFENASNNQILHNYIMQNYPSKLSVDVLESLEERQNKELSVRDEVLSIIRNGVILILDDIDIAPNELVLLAEHYRNIHAPDSKDLNKQDFTDFVNIYGVRVSDNGIYLLDEENIASNGYADNETIDFLYNIYLKTKNNYKDRLEYLNKRKSLLSIIYEENVEFQDKKKISDLDLDNLYQAYKKTGEFDGIIKKFMQDVGIRILDNDIYLLNDDETINLRSFIDSHEEDKIAIILREHFDEDCYTENEKNFGLDLKGKNVNLSFEGLEEVENYFTR